MSENISIQYGTIKDSKTNESLVAKKETTENNGRRTTTIWVDTNKDGYIGGNGDIKIQTPTNEKSSIFSLSLDQNNNVTETSIDTSNIKIQSFQSNKLIEHYGQLSNDYSSTALTAKEMSQIENIRGMVIDMEGYNDVWKVCPAGYLTIGYGHKKMDNDPLIGLLGSNKLSKEAAVLLLDVDLKKHYIDLKKALGEKVMEMLSDKQLQVLISLSFNRPVTEKNYPKLVGHLRAAVNQKDEERTATLFKAQAEMNVFKAGSKVENGLIKRRIIEMRGFMNGELCQEAQTKILAVLGKPQYTTLAEYYIKEKGKINSEIEPVLKKYLTENTPILKEKLGEAVVKALNEDQILALYDFMYSEGIDIDKCENLKKQLNAVAAATNEQDKEKALELAQAELNIWGENQQHMAKRIEQMSNFLNGRIAKPALDKIIASINKKYNTKHTSLEFLINDKKIDKTIRAKLKKVWVAERKEALGINGKEPKNQNLAKKVNYLKDVLYEKGFKLEDLLYLSENQINILYDYSKSKGAGYIASNKNLLNALKLAITATSQDAKNKALEQVQAEMNTFGRNLEYLPVRIKQMAKFLDGKLGEAAQANILKAIQKIDIECKSLNDALTSVKIRANSDLYSSLCSVLQNNTSSKLAIDENSVSKPEEETTVETPVNNNSPDISAATASQFEDDINAEVVSVPYPGSEYTIQNGDTYYKIAEIIHTQLEEEYGKINLTISQISKQIQAANKIPATKLQLGKPIKIPELNFLPLTTN